MIKANIINKKQYKLKILKIIKIKINYKIINNMINKIRITKIKIKNKIQQ